MRLLSSITAPNSWGLRFKKNYSPAQASEQWSKIVPSLAEFSESLKQALLPNFRSAQRREAALSTFASMLGAVIRMHPDTYASFASEIEYVTPV